jgi:glycine cleavage system aminomethyltransferase T
MESWIIDVNQDLDSYTTPMECGRGFRCKMKSDIPFIGNR